MYYSVFIIIVAWSYPEMPSILVPLLVLDSDYVLNEYYFLNPHVIKSKLFEFLLLVI